MLSSEGPSKVCDNERMSHCSDINISRLADLTVCSDFSVYLSSKSGQQMAGLIYFRRGASIAGIVIALNSRGRFHRSAQRLLATSRSGAYNRYRWAANNERVRARAAIIEKGLMEANLLKEEKARHTLTTPTRSCSFQLLAFARNDSSTLLSVVV